MKIRTVIFDLYGVLALNGWQAFKAHHFSGREDVWTEVFELGRKVDAGLADYAELILFTAQKTGESEDTVRYQLEHTVANEELFTYIEHSLKPHYKLGILSNASSSKVLSEVFKPTQVALFDSITLSHHVGLTKPDKAMYEAAAERLVVEVGECLFIDDQERHANGARNAGMKALVYTNFETLKQEISRL